MSFKDGRIGIGKTPIFPLDISGSCRIEGDLILGGRFSDSQGNAIQLGGGSGATSTPDQTQTTLPSWSGGTIGTQGLDVFKGKMTANSIYISGDNALPASVTGSNNTTLGVGAGLNLTSGVSNVMIGFEAGNTTTDKKQNVHIGQYAGYSKNKSYNTFIGYLSGSSCDSEYNVAVGMNSLKTTNEGSNIALGYSALRGHMSYLGIKGSIGIGYQAGFAQGNSDYNIWMGHQAGPQTASSTAGTGNNNVAIGLSSLASITTGYDNVAIGQKAMWGLTSAHDNIALGKFAGYSITSGDHNIFLGYYAGQSSTGESNNNIGIGREAARNITGGQNVSIGGFSMKVAAASDYNVSIGYESCLEVTAFTGNTYIGHHAAKWYATRGGENVGIGGYAHAQGTGNYCVAIGYQCIYYGDKDDLIAIGYRANHQHHGTNNIAIGKEAMFGNAGNLTTNDGNNCIAIGYRTGYQQCGGDHCIMIGYEAGKSLTTGLQNVIIGSYCGVSMTTGYENVCIGYGTLSNHISGRKNVAIGYQAGNSSNTNDLVAIGHEAGYYCDAEKNIAIGKQALRQCTTSQANIAIGFQAGYNITTGNGNNIAIGYEAYDNSSTGKENIAIGLFAIHGNNCTGQNNIAIGGTSGKMLTSGYGNTCVGQGSGFNITTGLNNQCFGRYAGYWCNTGDANICIGFSAGPKDTGGGQLNNRLYIGNIDHADSRGVDSYIYGDMTLGSEKLVFNANVGIGTTSPDANLHVYGTGKKLTNTSYQTKTWAQTKTEVESQGGFLPTRDQILAQVNNLLISGQDKWAAGVTRLGGGVAHKQWYQIGNSSGHAYGMEHVGYPSWGDSTTSYLFRDTIAIVQKPLKINHGFFIKDYETSPAWGEAVFQVVKASTNYLAIGFSDGTSSSDSVLEALNITRVGNVGIGTTDPKKRLVVCYDTTNMVSDYQDTDGVLNVYGGEGRRCINIVTQGNHSGSSSHHRYPAMVFHPTRDNTIQHGPGGAIVFTDRPGSGTYANQVRQTDILIQTSARHEYNRILRDVCTISADGYVRGINAFQNDSDDRIKHNEKNINKGLNVINKLQAKLYLKTSTLFDENGNIYDLNHNFNLNHDGLPIDASGDVLIDVNKEIGFIAQEVFEIDELKHAVQEGDWKPDASGNMYQDKFGLCYEEIFVYNVVATQELYRENQELKARLAKIEAYLGI